jgi:hypothetical protein
MSFWITFRILYINWIVIDVLKISVNNTKLGNLGFVVFNHQFYVEYFIDDTWWGVYIFYAHMPLFSSLGISDIIY